jgi:hypothetical protein
MINQNELVPQRSIFRSRALRSYLQERERDVLPHVVTPLLFAWFWLLLLLISLLGLLILTIQLPISTTAQGSLLPAALTTHTLEQAIFFLPSDITPDLHSGDTIQIRDTTGMPQFKTFTAKIVKLEPGILNPDTIQKKYFPRQTFSLITKPSHVIIVSLDRTVSLSSLANHTLQTQIHATTLPLLSMYR